MLHTEIEIEASPSVVRETFLNFAAIPSYHTEFLKQIVPDNKDKKDIEPGDKLTVTAGNMSFNPVVEVNSSTEFTWRGTLGSTWLFTGAHTFKFLPAGEDQQKTRLVQAEEFGGCLVPVFSLFGMADTKRGFERFNEDLKKYVEDRHR